MIYTSITCSDPSITVAGNNAIVRHRESVEARSEEKTCQWNLVSCRSGKGRTANGDFWRDRDGRPEVTQFNLS
jgi:hypothetical protein